MKYAKITEYYTVGKEITGFTNTYHSKMLIIDTRNKDERKVIGESYVVELRELSNLHIPLSGSAAVYLT